LNFEVGDFVYPRGVTYEWFAPFQGMRQAHT
jgi:hypothetical protein